MVQIVSCKQQNSKSMSWKSREGRLLKRWEWKSTRLSNTRTGIGPLNSSVTKVTIVVRDYSLGQAQMSIASTSFRNLLEIQTLEPDPDLLNQKIRDKIHHLEDSYTS